MSKLRWEKNNTGGITLQRWVAGFERPLLSGRVWKVAGYWHGIADVYKAKKGERYVVRILRPTSSGFDQYQAHSLREAMRMAKLLVGVTYGS